MSETQFSRLVRYGLLAVAAMGSVALLASSPPIPSHANVLAAGFAMLCTAIALIIESTLILSSSISGAEPSYWRWIGGGTILLVFVASAIRLASPLSAHQLASCLVLFLSTSLLLASALAGSLGWRILKHVVPVSIACFVLFVLAGSAEWAAAPNYHNQLGVVLPVTAGGGFVSLLLLPFVRSRLEYEAAVTPVDSSEPGQGQSVASGRVTSALGMVALVTLSSFASLLTLTYVAAMAAKIRPRGGLVSGDIRIFVVAAVVIALTVALWAASSRIPARPPYRRILQAYCLAGILVPAITLLISCAKLPFSVLGAIVSVIVGVWDLNSLINNISVLQLRPATPYVLVISVCSSFLGAAITYWTLVGAVSTSHGARSFAVSATLAIGAALLNILLISVLPVLGLNSFPHATEFTVQHNLFQDSLSISAIVLVIEWPVEFLRVSSGQWWIAVSLSTGLIPLFSSGFLWAVHSNHDHVRRQARRLLGSDASRVLAITHDENSVGSRVRLLINGARGNLKGPQNERLVRVLSAHVSNQNLLAYLAVLAALVGALTIAMDALKDSGWINRVTSLSRLAPTITPDKR